MREDQKSGLRKWQFWDTIRHPKGMASPARWVWVWGSSGLLMHWEACCAAVHGAHKKSDGTEWLNWLAYFIFLGHYFADKCPYSQCCGFSSSHVWMWELDYQESWASKKWCFWTVVVEKPLESPLDCREIQPVHPKGNQSWIFIGRTTAEGEVQYFGHLMQRADSLERPRGWERLKAGGEGDDRG